VPVSFISTRRKEVLASIHGEEQLLWTVVAGSDPKPLKGVAKTRRLWKKLVSCHAADGV